MAHDKRNTRATIALNPFTAISAPLPLAHGATLCAAAASDKAQHRNSRTFAIRGEIAMSRLILALLLLSSCAAASAESCSVSGTAFDAHGQPLRNAVVRLTNQDTHRSSFAVADGSATYQLPADAGANRLDVLGPETKVTGSLIPTRSVMGSAEFSCRGSARQDVRAGVS